MSPYIILFVFLSLVVHLPATELRLNGHPIQEGINHIKLGDAVDLKCMNPSDETQLVLREKQSLMIWFKGAAKDFSMQFINLRPQAFHLEAQFKSPDSSLTFSLEPKNGRVIYPGVKFQLIRMHKDDPIVPSLSRFEPPSRALGVDPRTLRSEDQIYLDYPAYRVSESVLDLNLQQPKFTRPDYWHGVLSTFYFTENSNQRRLWLAMNGPLPVDLTDQIESGHVANLQYQEEIQQRGKTKIVDRNISVKLKKNAQNAAMAIKGFLWIPHSEPTTFRITSSMPFRLHLGELSQGVDVPRSSLDPHHQIEFLWNGQPGLIPWNLLLSNVQRALSPEELLQKHLDQEKASRLLKTIEGIEKEKAIAGAKKNLAKAKKSNNKNKISAAQKRLETATSRHQQDKEKLPSMKDELKILQAQAKGPPSIICVEWKKTGMDKFQVIPPRHYFHEIPPSQESAYRHFCGDQTWRNLPLNAKVNDNAVPFIKPLEESLEKRISEAISQNKKSMAQSKTSGNRIEAMPLTAKNVRKRWNEDGDVDYLLKNALITYFKNGKEEDFKHVMDVMIDYIDGLYGRQGMFWHGKGDKTNPQMYSNSLLFRAYLEIGMRMPQYQGDILNLRAGLHADLTAAILGRSFFNEFQKGANDGAYRSSGFLNAMWNIAKSMDNPLAWDASRSHYDNHFRYSGNENRAHRYEREGLQFDGAYAFHSSNGLQFCTGAYGEHWFKKVANDHHLGTPWGHTREQYRRLTQMVLMDDWTFHRSNRSLFRNGRYQSLTYQGAPGNIDTAKRLLALPEPALDSQWRQNLWDMILNRDKGIGKTGHTFFHNFLLTQHQRNDYRIEVKLHSPISGPLETFSGRQPVNLFWADGLTLLLRHGYEYEGLNGYSQPDFNFRISSLPGTTQLSYEWGVNDKTDIGKYRKNMGGEFAAGVSNGSVGNCSFDFKSVHQTSTKAKKFYMFTEDGMGAMGVDIDASSPSSKPYYSYRTNLNQCVLSDKVQVYRQNNEIEELSLQKTGAHLTYPLDQRIWIEHGGIGYLIFPTGNEQGQGEPGTLHIKTSIRTPYNRIHEDEWKTRKTDVLYKASLEKSKTRQTPTLEIWIDHGNEPQNGCYTYFVSMRPEKKSPLEWIENPPIQVTSLTPELMAIKDLEANIHHAFFREPGTLSLGNTPFLKTNHPCSLMFEDGEQGFMNLHIQDARAGATYDIALLANVIQVDLMKNEKWISRNITMPGAGCPDARYHGKTVSVKF